jgi:hypothetical protein
MGIVPYRPQAGSEGQDIDRESDGEDEEDQTLPCPRRELPPGDQSQDSYQDQDQRKKEKQEEVHFLPSP